MNFYHKKSLKQFTGFILGLLDSIIKAYVQKASESENRLSTPLLIILDNFFRLKL